MNRIIVFQGVILAIAGSIFYLLYGKMSALFLLLAGISIMAPNLLLLNNFLCKNFKQATIWCVVALNKLFLLTILVISIKTFKQPDYVAFLVGIIVVTQTPLMYVLFFYKYNKH